MEHPFAAILFYSLYQNLSALKSDYIKEGKNICIMNKTKKLQMGVP